MCYQKLSVLVSVYEHISGLILGVDEKYWRQIRSCRESPQTQNCLHNEPENARSNRNYNIAILANLQISRGRVYFKANRLLGQSTKRSCLWAGIARLRGLFRPVSVAFQRFCPPQTLHPGMTFYRDPLLTDRATVAFSKACMAVVGFRKCAKTLRLDIRSR